MFIIIANRLFILLVSCRVACLHAAFLKVKQFQCVGTCIEAFIYFLRTQTLS